MKAKILVIDPSVTIQKVIGIMLSDGPYEVFTCTTQEEYDKCKAQGGYDLIVADYRFTDNFISQVKQDFSNAKILAMLGTFDQKDEGELLRQGADDCIVRPFESGKFVEKCNKLLEGRSETSSSTSPAETSTETPAPSDQNPHFDPLPSAAAEDEEEDLELSEFSSPTINVDLKDQEEHSDHPEDQASDGAQADVDDNHAAAADGEKPLPEEFSTDDIAFAEMDNPPPEQAETSSGPNPSTEEGHTSLDDTLSGWSVNAPAIKPEAAAAPEEKLGDDALAQAVAGWGMSVPDVISDTAKVSTSSTDFTGEIPGVIGEEGATADALPAQQDLAYPEESKGKSSAEILSKLVPIENLSGGDSDDDFEDADRTVSMEIAPDLLKNDGLEEEIAKELSAEEFWSPEEEGKEAAKTETSPSSATTTSSPSSSPSPASSTTASSLAQGLTPQLLAEIKQAIPGVDKDALLAEVKQALPSLAAQEMGPQLQDILRPEIDKVVQEYCQKTIEHVAWEIIPDLAENLIKQHLKTIAEEAKQSF